MPSPPRRRLLLCAPRAALADLAELVQAWREQAVDVDIEAYETSVPDLAALVATWAQPLDAALLVAPARRAPGTVLAAPFASGRDGQRVPMAYVPSRDSASLRRFAHTAARVQRRAGAQRALALLGQWLPRYLHVTQRMQRLVAGAGAGLGLDGVGTNQKDTVRAFRWTSDAITRESMVGALGCGLGLGLYVGHGRPVGWVGYHGVRAHHFEPAPESSCGNDTAAQHTAAAPVRQQTTERPGAREPMGAILSLCCRTASRRRVGLSYAEALPLLGVSAASFGAVGDTLHTDNTRWAVGVCRALTQGARTVGELLVRAAPNSPSALASYRLIGDPLAPLGCDEPALRRAGRVRTYE